MDKSQVRVQTNDVKKYLEGILSNYDGFFVARTDIKAIKEFIKEADDHYEGQIRASNCYSIDVQRGRCSGSYEMKPYEFKIFGADIVERIIDHASQYKETGEVMYKIEDKFISSDEIIEKLNYLVNNSEDMSKDTKFLLKSFRSQVKKKFNLSAKQVRIIESQLKNIESLEAKV